MNRHTEITAAIRKALPPELIAQRIADLPRDAQERLRREFAPRPSVRRFNFTDTRKP
jgi:hypothetical protein